MAKTIYLLRHTEPEHTNMDDDHKRPLTDKGHKDAQNLAKVLSEDGVQPDLMLSSNAVRTSQTAKPFREVWSDVEISFRDDLYLASAGHLHSLLRSLDDEFSSVLIIGHNPGLYEFLKFMTASALPTMFSDLEYDYQMGVWTELSCQWDSWDQLAPGRNNLVAMLKDGNLKKLSDLAKTGTDS